MESVTANTLHASNATFGHADSTLAHQLLSRWVWTSERYNLARKNILACGQGSALCIGRTGR